MVKITGYGWPMNLFDDASFKRKDNFCMLSIFQATEEQIW